MDTIVIDDIPNSKETNCSITHVIDLDEDNSNDEVEILGVHKPIVRDQFLYDIFDENEDLAVLMKKCISLDISGAMSRVMKKTLLPIYQSTNDAFKKSIQFERALAKVICKIDSDPTHKYSHIKDFCDFLRDNVSKKKVSLTTLSTKVSGKTVHKRNHTSAGRIVHSVCIQEDSQFQNHHYEKRRKGVKKSVINLENDHNELPTIDLDAHSNNVPDNTSIEIADDDHVVDNEKENASANIGVSYDEINKVSNETFIEFEVPNITNTPQNENVHLQPIYSQILEDTTTRTEQELANKIRSIESQIEIFKNILDKLNEAEVLQDDSNSPYIQCEYYKYKIVKLYQQLCELTGQDPVKRRKVRLKAKDSRSTLPLMKLQSLINSKIGSDGLPHFPDLEEVIQCVDEANLEGNLFWDNKRILQEARALFTYCGRAIQRGRQRREWRDVLSMVKTETLEDPADQDPELAAKLERNRLVAIHKENEVLDMYASMENRRHDVPVVTDKQIQMEMEQSEDEVEDDQIKISSVVSYGNPNSHTASNTTLSQVNYAKEPVLSNSHDQIRKSVINTTSNQVQITNSVVNREKDDMEDNQIKISNVVSYGNTGTHTASNINLSQLNNPDLPNSDDQITKSVINTSSNQEQTTDSVNNTHLQFLSIGYWNVSNNVLVLENDVDKNSSGISDNAQQNELKSSSITLPNQNQNLKKNVKVYLGVSDDDTDNGIDPREILAEPLTNNTTSSIEVLSIEVDNSPTEDLHTGISNHNNSEIDIRESDDNIREQPIEKLTTAVFETRDEGTLPNSSQNCCDNVSEDTNKDINTEIQNGHVEDVKVKIERTAEDVLRELNEMDGDNLISTIIGIEDPFLVIEISSDSESESDDEMEVDVEENDFPVIKDKET